MICFISKFDANSLSVKSKLLTLLFVFCLNQVIAQQNGCVAKVEPHVLYKKDKYTPEIILPRIDFINSQVVQYINSHLTLKALLGKENIEIEDQIKENRYNDSDMGISSLTYEVLYNQNCFLSLAVYSAYTGAYMSHASLYRNFDLKTGKLTSGKSLFKLDQHKTLIGLAEEKLQNQIKIVRKELEGTDKESLGLYDEFTKLISFRESSLNQFYIDEKKQVLTFVVDLEFPHAFKAMQPSGEVVFTFEEIKPFIDPKSALSFLLHN